MTDGDAMQEFHRAIGMRRLADGRVVVADGGSHQLRWFAPDGRYLLSTGARGDGPGEFRGGVSIFPAAGDSLLTYDSNLQRLMLFSPDGVFGRVVTTGREGTAGFDWAPWIYRRAVVLNAPAGPVRGCTIAALDAMPLPSAEAGMRMIMVDDIGRLWVRQVEGEVVRWTVWSRDGALLGEAPLPPGFDPVHIGGDFILGRGYSDADDTERIRMFALRDDRGSGRCLSETATRRTDDQPRPQEIAAALRNLVVAQEMVYADLASYTADIARLPITVPEPLVLRLFRADRRGWAGALLDPASEFSCAISMGDNFPGGWLDGTIMCG